MVKTIPEAFAFLGKLYEERNALYGDTYRDFGKLLMALFPGGFKIDNDQDANRLAIVLHIADKLARYCKQMKSGGHVDSLDDVSVYAQLLQQFDAECREANKCSP